MVDDQSPSLGPSQRAVGRTRSWLVVLGVVAIVSVFALGWLAASRFESPQQRAARAKPPAAGPLFERVTRGELVDAASGPARVTYSHEDSIRVPSVIGSVVTSHPAAQGSILREGDAAIAANGRPVIVFTGKFDFYRSLRRNDTGPDVAQMQRGLAAAGYSVSDAKGTFGPGTARALRLLYARDGFSAANGLPLSEVAVIHHLPARLARVEPVGAHLTADAVATAGWGTRVATVVLSASDIVRVSRGAHARFVPASGRGSVEATVRSKLTDSSNTQRCVLYSASGFRRSVIGESGVGIVTLAVVSRQALLVPSRAVAIDRDGTARVLVRVSSSRSRAIDVHVLGTLAGRSAVAPLTTDALRAGDLVRVG